MASNIGPTSPNSTHIPTHNSDLADIDSGLADIVASLKRIDQLTGQLLQVAHGSRTNAQLPSPSDPSDDELSRRIREWKRENS